MISREPALFHDETFPGEKAPDGSVKYIIQAFSVFTVDLEDRAPVWHMALCCRHAQDRELIALSRWPESMHDYSKRLAHELIPDFDAKAIEKKVWIDKHENFLHVRAELGFRERLLVGCPLHSHAQWSGPAGHAWLN